MTSRERPGLKRLIAWALDLLDRSLDGSDGRDSDGRADDSAKGRAQPKRGLVVAGTRQAEEDAARKGRERLVEGLAAVEALGLVLDAVKGPSVREALSLPRAAEHALSARSGLLDVSAAAPTAIDDDGFAERHALALARRGLARLLGSAGSNVAGSVSVLGSARVPEESLLRLLRGELDAFRAAEVAAQASRHPGTREELILLAGRDAEGRLDAAERSGARPEVFAPLRLAADGPTPIRDPAQGVLVTKGVAKGGAKDKGIKEKAAKGSAKRASPNAPSSSLEAFRFADGVLAIYAARPLPLTLVEGRGRGVSSPRVVGSAPGYLELSLPARAQKRTLLIQVGLEDAVLVELELT